MTEAKTLRLNKVAKELNVGIETIVEFLKKKKFEIDNNPNSKISTEMYNVLLEEFSSDSNLKKKSNAINISTEKTRSISIEDINSDKNKTEKNKAEEDDEEFMNFPIPTLQGPKVIGKIELNNKKTKPAIEKKEPEVFKTEVTKVEGPKIIDKIDIDQKTKKTSKKKKKTETAEPPSIKNDDAINNTKTTIEDSAKEIITEEPKNITEQEKEEIFRTEVKKIDVPKVVDKIDLSQLSPKTTQKPTEEQQSKHKDDKKTKPVFSTAIEKDNKQKEEGRIKHDKKRKRKRINVAQVASTIFEETSKKETDKSSKYNKKYFKKDKKKKHRYEVDKEEVERSIKSTISSMQSKGKSQFSKYRREKRDAISQRMQEELQQQEIEKKTLKITEFISVGELANLIDVPVNEIISTCMSLGLFVSINQRLDADTITIIADEYGYKTEFITVEVQTDYQDEEKDKEEDLKPRPPIVTVMGHVDHGKTKLLDYIRNTNVVAGEAGGITQHIGAYNVTLDNGRQITFLDTPGHEAFTAMRARGAQVTDIAIIVIAADDGIKPQTIEAINHAQAANVPMIFAINKIDKPEANPDKVREQLANMNLLVEEWGGKYQSQEIAAKQGLNVNLLLEKILLEADILELKANPNRRASGVVIESSLDKGKGYVANVLVKNGTLKIGDIILAGTFYGRVKAMFNERNQQITTAGPSTPIQVLGLNGAPQAGDKFNVLSNEQEAKEIANKRLQILREQSLRTKKHITLDEIGRRLKVGNFKELNIIIKGDVDGSIEALSDSLIKLSNEEIQINVIHKGVGQISESDVMLAAASEAIIIGFQVRPSISARKLAESEHIEIRLYSIIYDAIEEIKSAIEGMLSPIIKEEIIGSAEVKQIFKIGGVGTVAGCFVHEGKISRSGKIRIIRDGIVAYTGELNSLKRFKDDVSEVTSGLECGLSIEKFNDIKVGDIIECYNEVEMKKKL